MAASYVIALDLLLLKQWAHFIHRLVVNLCHEHFERVSYVYSWPSMQASARTASTRWTNEGMSQNWSFYISASLIGYRPAAAASRTPGRHPSGEWRGGEAFGLWPGPAGAPHSVSPASLVCSGTAACRSTAVRGSPALKTGKNKITYFIVWGQTWQPWKRRQLTLKFYHRMQRYVKIPKGQIKECLWKSESNNL